MMKAQKYFKKPDLSKTVQAFTLVELMVVVAIIAGLLMMALPNIRKHRARARSTQCQNNLRQYMVAMNQYMAENEGYFIYTASGYAGATDSTIGLESYGAGVVRYGGKRGSTTHSWLQNFVPAYVPEPSITSMKFLRSGQNSVRICPEVNRTVFDPGTLGTPNPDFKGFQSSVVAGEETITADFESENGYTSSGPDGELILSSAFTTYGINNWSPVYGRPRASITNNNAIAFIDWNAEEGWGATIVRTIPTTWQFTGQDRAKNPVAQGDIKPNTNWWISEVGFYHPGRSNDMVANFVAIDGSVHAISSNEIRAANFR